MIHLIDKDALLAEITHKIKDIEAFVKNFDGISDKVEKAKNKIEALGDTLLFIENIEVKDVDFEKIWKEHFEQDGDVAAVSVKPIVKHFFELGLKSKSSYVGIPNVDDTLKEMGVDPDSKLAKSFKESYFRVLDELQTKQLQK